MFDLKIINGTVVDGTGAPARQASVAVKDGKIAEVGPCDGAAARVIDAQGALVTPGFVDLHCHYDGQVSWDADLAPSCFHGVTTAVLGNCGVGFAPVHPEDRERLIALMEGVEDIPGAALAEGIRWRWSSFSEYMRGVDDFAHTIDFALQVPHDALRVYVMRERALAGQPATDDDVAAMRRLVREAVIDGAAGFTTGRSDNHRARDGSATPASEAGAAELRGIARAFEGLDRGVLQAVSDFDMAEGDHRFEPEFDVLEAMVEASGGRPFAVSLSQRDMSPDQWKRILGRVEAGKKKGLDMHVLVAPRGIGMMLGLEVTFHPFMGFPSYKAISHLPMDEQVRRMRDPAFKARILKEKSEPVSGDGSPIPPLADKLLAGIDFVSMRFFRLSERPNYEPSIDDSLCAEAQRRGCSPLEAIYDALLEDDGRQLLYFPVFNYTGFSFDAVSTMLHHPQALPGLSDGGAHVGTVCDASFPSYWLMHWARDRKDRPDHLPVERVVQMLSGDGARFIGLRDRGELRPGLRADINVIDLPRLSLPRPRLVRDLPGGGKRLLQGAQGYRATLVAGQVTVENDQLTGARPGRLARVSLTPSWPAPAPGEPGHRGRGGALRNRGRGRGPGRRTRLRRGTARARRGRGGRAC